jgi:hypothetical protein
MPTFKRVGGGHIWIPKERILEANTSLGLLSTFLLVVVPTTAQSPGGIAQIEVEGSLATVAALLDGAPAPSVIA